MSSGAVGLRRMVAGDLDRVIEIAATLATAPHWDREAYVGAIAEGDWLWRAALVAEFDEEVAGFAVAAVVADEAELESIAVADKAQGRGIGTALIAALIRELQVEGVKELRLEVRASNGAAIRLYERTGFRETGRRWGYYREPEEDAMLMGLRLTSGLE